MAKQRARLEALGVVLIVLVVVAIARFSPQFGALAWVVSSALLIVGAVSTGTGATAREKAGIWGPPLVAIGASLIVVVISFVVVPAPEAVQIAAGPPESGIVLSGTKPVRLIIETVDPKAGLFRVEARTWPAVKGKWKSIGAAKCNCTPFGFAVRQVDVAIVKDKGSVGPPVYVEVRNLPRGSFFGALGSPKTTTASYVALDSVSWKQASSERGVSFSYLRPPFQYFRSPFEAFLGEPSPADIAWKLLASVMTLGAVSVTTAGKTGLGGLFGLLKGTVAGVKDLFGVKADTSKPDDHDAGE